MPSSLIARRNALFALFLLPGLGISSWVTRTPDVRNLLDASTAQMGFILFGLSIGSMIGILGSGPLVARFGTRPVIMTGGFVVASGVTVVGVGAAVTQPWLVAFGLGLIGLGMGGGEVAMNVDGAEVERLLHRSVMPTLHGFFSFGTVIGALIGMGLTAVQFPVVWHLVITAAVMAGAIVVAIRSVPAGFGRHEAAHRAERADHPPVWRDVHLLMIGGIVLALAMSEGAAGDWLPLLMVDGHGFSDAIGSATYAIFAICMTAGRFGGGWFVDRFGRAIVLAISAIVAGIGLATVVFVDNQVAAAVAVVFWGIGTSLGFPVAMSAAGDSGENSAARVSFTATIGYIAFLVGPPLLGMLGEHFGLRLAMLVVLALIAIAVLLTPGIRRRPTAPAPTSRA